MDQAETLRRLMESRLTPGEGAEAGTPKVPRVITVMSAGRNGGKSLVAGHLAALLARSGRRVVLANSLWSSALPVALDDVLKPGASLDGRYLSTVEERLRAAYVSPDFFRARQDTGTVDQGLARALELAGFEADDVVIETGMAQAVEEAGIVPRPGFINVMVLTPGDESIGGAHSLLAHFRREAGITAMSVVVNRTESLAQGRSVFKALAEAAIRLVDMRLEYLGCLPEDEKISLALSRREFLIDLYPGASASDCLRLVHKRLEAGSSPTESGDSRGSRRQTPGKVLGGTR